MIYGGLKRLLAATAAVAAVSLWPVGTALSVGVPMTLVLTPVIAVNPVGALHCVTATLRDDTGATMPGVFIDFWVSPSNSATNPTPGFGSIKTNAIGQAQFCYRGFAPGLDTINAVAEGGVAAPTTQGSTGSPSAVAFKVWAPMANLQLCQVDITNGGWFIADNLDHVNFGGNAQNDSGGNPSGQEEFQDQGPAQPMNVHTISIAGIVCNDDRTSATIYGEATMNGSGDHPFKIDVTDAGEPGTNDMYGLTFFDTPYTSGLHLLMGGNIQIH